MWVRDALQWKADASHGGLQARTAVGQLLTIVGRHHHVALAIDELGTLQVGAQPRRQVLRMWAGVTLDALEHGHRRRRNTADDDLDWVRQRVEHAAPLRTGAPPRQR